MFAGIDIASERHWLARLDDAGKPIGKALEGLAAQPPPDADPGEVARAIVRVVGLPFGERPFRVHIDPAQDGAELVNAVADRMRREMYRDIGLADLLAPHKASG